MDDKQALLAIHRKFLNREPTPIQGLLYSAFPESLGFSHTDWTKDSIDRIEAVAVLGIWRTWSKGGEETPDEVFFFARSTAEVVQCLDVIRSMVKGLFARIKEQDTSRELKIRAAKAIGDLLGRIHIGTLPQDSTMSPKSWVAYGYCASDGTVPVWLRKHLISA